MRFWKWGAGVVLACGVLLGGAMAAMAEAEVTDVTAVPRYPWNGLVDIRCTVMGLAEGGAGGEFEMAAVDGESGSVREVSHFQVAGTEEKEVGGNGEYELVWDARADLGEVVVSNMVVRVTVREKEEDSHVGVQLWEGGPYWADRNLGADHPWDYGLYFWWGDTEGASPGGFSFDWDDTPTMEKDWDELQAEGWITAAGVLAPAHDAAHVQWGGGWRMPTYVELVELCYDKCDWSWTTMNGVNGCRVRGRGDFAEASIFIPAAGNGNGNGTAGSYCYLWSSDPHVGSLYRYYSWYLYFYSNWGRHDMNGSYRYNGFSIRPVRGAAE